MNTRDQRDGSTVFDRNRSGGAHIQGMSFGIAESPMGGRPSYRQKEVISGSSVSFSSNLLQSKKSRVIRCGTRWRWMVALILTVGVFIWASAMVGAFPSSSEDLGRRYFQSAQLFYTRGDYEQALKDWTFIIENLPKSAYADDALIAIGRYHLEVNHDPQTASRFFERVLAEYPQADKAPAAHFFQGRIRYDYGMTLADLQDALASFERVTVLYPRSGWAGEAALLAGEIHRLLGEP